MKIGIVGLGKFNQRVHAPALLKYSEAVSPLEFVLCDPNKANVKKWIENFGEFICYSNTEDMISKESLDAAYVTVRPSDCLKAVIPFLNAGIPLFTEKPPGMNSDETKSTSRTYWPGQFPMYYRLVLVRGEVESQPSKPCEVALLPSHGGDRCQICGKKSIGYCHNRQIYVCSAHNIYTARDGTRWRCP